MPLTLSISPHGRLLVHQAEGAAETRIQEAFERGSAEGLLHLATDQLRAPLPPAFAFAREIAKRYLTRLCHQPALGEIREPPSIPRPDEGELSAMLLQTPPMQGAEYLSIDLLGRWWEELDAWVRAEAAGFEGGVQAYLREKNPLWRLVGRVTFHLAENKRDESNPFAFMATYAKRLSDQAKLQYLPLGRALQEYAGAKNRIALVTLLKPIEQAAQKSQLAQELVESGDIYQPQLWQADQAYRFLRDIPVFEESGLLVRVPDWWKSRHPPRPQVSVNVGTKTPSKLGADALLDFSARVTLEGETLGERELQSILASGTGLVRLRGQWVEVDKEKLSEALDHWKKVEREVAEGGVSFFEGMRLLSGTNLGQEEAAAEGLAQAKEWFAISAGEALAQTLEKMRCPEELDQAAAPPGLKAQLRPYQQTGVQWLRFLTRLGLGPCLADDMGLGKTIQVIGLLLHIKESIPSLLVVPASLLSNWKSELERFAPSLRFWIAHPSEGALPSAPEQVDEAIKGCHLVITTYSMVSRLQWLKERKWNLVILDEAQAIKNPSARQTRQVKELDSAARVALTGTPVENRLGDLWSLFDFLNPGLLGSAKAFSQFIKSMGSSEDENPYAPLRSLVQPYILRRLKTDKKIIADLPDKTETNAFCLLSKQQTALYEQAVRELERQLKESEGIKRRGIILAYLLRFKQICNHPSQWTGDGSYDPRQSGKFQRLAELCEELSQRQEKVLVFTQFREITDPLADFLGGVFGRSGLVLHGGTAVGKRRGLVEDFQREDGPPFFILSIKAGGTGLNLTAASHVIHFDRWWNPAVENQATDRAFRIGQKRNVFVHKFICRGTVEDKIDALIEQKKSLSRDVLEGGGEQMLTEMDDKQLLDFVSLDINKAAETS
jgi:non-specific serine/threonine protein kinase